MKRHNNLWSDVIEFENLLLASRQAQKGKRFRDNVLAFNYNLERELAQLRHELQTKTYQPGTYRTFRVMEPKPRMISAAPYRDRVVHHALCNIIVPPFERTFIADTYANRVGFGTHRALKRFTHFARSHRHILQCDLKKYFPSIDHETLKHLIRRKLKCQDTLWLIDKIIDNSNEQEPVLHHFPGDDLITPLTRRRGLPIGNLTSQFFANIYLNGFDHFIKEHLHISSYLRYVDDFALFSDDPDQLAAGREAIESYLADLRLKIHPIKSQQFTTHQGATFLGFRILPDRIRVRTENLRRAKRRIRRLQTGYAKNTVTLQQLSQSLQSWFAHLEAGDTWKLRQKLHADLPFSETIAVAL